LDQAIFGLKICATLFHALRFVRAHKFPVPGHEFTLNEELLKKLDELHAQRQDVSKI